MYRGTTADVSPENVRVRGIPPIPPVFGTRTGEGRRREGTGSRTSRSTHRVECRKRVETEEGNVKVVTEVRFFFAVVDTVSGAEGDEAEEVVVVGDEARRRTTRVVTVTETVVPLGPLSDVPLGGLVVARWGLLGPVAS